MAKHLVVPKIHGKYQLIEVGTRPSRFKAKQVAKHLVVPEIDNFAEVQ
jgi:hypothetical protein